VTPKLYKAVEVCEAAGLQPYVLRSWEKEFPGIGVQRSQDSPRLYRQSDLDQVLRIKQLVFGEGLTLAGARRRLEESSPREPDADNVERAEVLETLGADARARIAAVRHGLRSLLEVLSKGPGAAGPIPPLELPFDPPGRRAPSNAGSRERSASKPAAKMIAKRGIAVKSSGGSKKKRASA
jgi:DNA-binding transcriptional MerR regulator